MTPRGSTSPVVSTGCIILALRSCANKLGDEIPARQRLCVGRNGYCANAESEALAKTSPGLGKMMEKAQIPGDGM